ncbi:hypothetical protein WMF31_37590 [Sorangium sp. So ce1036]|uniref:hypothetical protein n=1 Tax=Sorangium sp. So ce1036 TaxID=3133328 RepID=UPI003F03ACBA
MRKDDREPKASRAERALQKMTSALRKECDSIRKELASTGTDDAKVRHRLGILVNAIRKEPNKYGQGGVEQLARALGFDKTLLYRHAKVAECWSSRELSELLRRKSVTGLPISFSHLQLLVTVTDPTKREEYIETVLAEGLSVRDLGRRLNPAAVKASRKKSSQPDAEHALRGLQTTLEIWTDRVDLLEAEVLPTLGSAPPSLELRSKYEQALAQQQAFVERVNKLGAQIGAWLASGAEGAPAEAQNDANADEHATAAE